MSASARSPSLRQASASSSNPPRSSPGRLGIGSPGKYAVGIFAVGQRDPPARPAVHRQAASGYCHPQILGGAYQQCRHVAADSHPRVGAGAAPPAGPERHHGAALLLRALHHILQERSVHQILGVVHVRPKNRSGQGAVLLDGQIRHPVLVTVPPPQLEHLPGADVLDAPQCQPLCWSAGLEAVGGWLFGCPAGHILNSP